MKRGLKKFVKVCALVIVGVVLVTAAAVLIVLLDKPLVKKAAQRYLTGKTGIALTVGRLDYRLFPLSVEAWSVKVSQATPVYSLEIAADRISLKGDLRKLIRGERPALETADADISEIRISQVKMSPEPIDFQGLILQMADILGASRRTTLKCGRAVVLLLSHDFRLDNTALTFTGGRSGGVFDVALSCEKIAAVMSSGRLSFGGGLNADGEMSFGRTAGVHLRLAVVNPRIDAAGRAAETDTLTMNVQGTWQPDKGIFRFPRLALDILGLASLTGTLDIVPGGMPYFGAEAKASLVNLEALERTAGAFVPAALRTVRLQGNVALEGKYTLSSGPEGKTGRISVLLKTPAIRWDYRGGRLPLRGKISGALRAGGPSADPQVYGDLGFESGELSGLGAVVESASGRFKFTGSKAAAQVTVPAAVLKRASVTLSGGRNVAFERIDLSGSVAARFGSRTFVEADLKMQLPGLAPVRLAGRIGLAPWRLYQASLDSPGQQVAALRGLLAPYLPKTLSSWAAGGTVDVSVKADDIDPARGQARLSGDITLSGGKFNDPGFTIASDGLHSRISIRGDYRTGRRELDGTAAIEIVRGESLWQRFYISWDKLPLKAELSGRFDSTTRALEGLAARLEVSGLGEVRANGRLGLATPLTFDFQANSRFALEPALSLFSQPQPPSQPGPQIKGESSSDIEVRKTSSGLALKGLLTLRGVSVVNPSTGFSVPSLSAELPLDLALPGTAAAPPAEAAGNTGAVRIGKVQTSRWALEVPPLSLTSSRNGYEIAPFSIEVFGGRLEFGKTSLALETSPLSLQGTSSVRLTETDISGLPFSTTSSSIKGTVRASFPELGITSKELRASGQAEADVFGGRVIVTDLAVRDPFARDRKISCDIDLLDLDLKRITDLVPFGEVTGIVRGQIQDLVIAYGQPEQFTLNLLSVDRKGVPRTFSLKAVNSLTVITSGQPAAPGAGSFWLRFIKGFRYDKIGIRSTLRNDTFTIDGTIKESGVEYLVKRPALFGISVINRNPGKTIGFKDMMSRLRRVGQSGAPETKSPGG